MWWHAKARREKCEAILWKEGVKWRCSGGKYCFDHKEGHEELTKGKELTYKEDVPTEPIYGKIDKGMTSTELFLAHLKAHPEERLWQAIRNWSGDDYIFTGNMSRKKGRRHPVDFDGIKVYIRDTFED